MKSGRCTAGAQRRWAAGSQNAELLDPTDSLALKGIAILAIVFHNYFHILLPVKENEFDFVAGRFTTFLAWVRDPRYTVQSCFAFLGHFGVQIFIFLSAYGLATKYSGVSRLRISFISGRLRKLYPTFIVSIVLWALFIGLPYGFSGPVLVVKRNAMGLLLTLIGIVNFVPGYGLPPVGPWWFMPFIMQFYLLWPLLNRFSQKYQAPGLLALAASCLGVTFCINDFLVQRWSINLLESPVGHMPEICLGIAAARYGLRSRGIYAAIAALVFLARYLVGSIWLLSYISALIVMLWLYKVGREALKPSRVLQYLGRCSLAIFLVNGFIRVPFLTLAVRFPNWFAGLVFGILSAAAAIGVSHFLSHPSRRQEVRSLS